MRYEVELTSQAIVQYIFKVLFLPETARKWADTLQSEIGAYEAMVLS